MKVFSLLFKLKHSNYESVVKTRLFHKSDLLVNAFTATQ